MMKISIYMGAVTDSDGKLLEDAAYLTTGSPDGQGPDDCEIEIRGPKAREVAAAIVGCVMSHDRLLSAARFVMAFYEPGQRHLDTEAWKHAEAQMRRAIAEAA